MTRFKSLLVVLVALVAVVAVAASGGSNKATKVNGGSSSGAPKNFAVGDEVKLGSWTVKVYGVTDPVQPTNQFIQPSAGNHWVGVDTEVKNLSSKATTVSSLACFDLRDAQNHSYTESIVSGVQPKAPDGEVQPNQALRGMLVFEVPQAATGLSLNFKCDLFSSGSATVKLS
jgi:hypothetical protein